MRIITFFCLNNHSNRNHDDSDVCFSKQISLTFLWTALLNCFKKKRQYNELVYDISMIQYLTSPKAFNLLRQVIPLPAFQNLYLKYGQNIQQEKKNLVDLNEIDTNVKNYIVENGLDVTKDGENVVCLAIDAFAFRSFCTTVLTSDKNPTADNIIIYNNGFIYLMVPVDFRYPPIILHIEKAQNGNYNEIIDKIAQEIKAILKNNGLNPWFHATDGDKFLSKSHTRFYLKFVQGNTSNFMELVHSIFEQLLKDDDLSVPVGDPLHLWKNIRSRYQNNSITLFSDSNTSTDCESAKRILEIGNALEDLTKAGKMRDSYCMKLFSFQNVCKLLKAGLFVDATLMFCFACWISADFSTNVDLQFRLFLLELSFQLIETFRQDFTSLKKNGIPQKAKDADVVTMHEEQYIIRMMNSLIASAIVLVFTSNFVRMDSVGTHLVENSIGIARQTSNDPRWERIITTFSHAALRKKIARKYGIQIHIQGRVNDGGCKVDQIADSQKPPGTLLSKPKNWSVVGIIQLFKGLCNPDTSKAFHEDCKNFIEELERISSLFKLKERNINASANCGILARFISFGCETDETEVVYARQ